MPDVTYKKNRQWVGEQTTLYIFSDGVYEVEKSAGSMWQFEEFTDFINRFHPRETSATEISRGKH